MTPYEKMSKQPRWPDGDEPDGMTDIKGGFVDGEGTAFRAPPGVTEAERINGVWYWKR